MKKGKKNWKNLNSRYVVLLISRFIFSVLFSPTFLRMKKKKWKVQKPLNKKSWFFGKWNVYLKKLDENFSICSYIRELIVVELEKHEEVK